MTLRVIPEDGPPLRVVAQASRIRILALLSGAALTMAEIAAETGLTCEAVGDHLRQLAAVGAIELAGGMGEGRRYLRTDPQPSWRVRDEGDCPQAVAAFTADLFRRWRALDHGAAMRMFDGELWVEPQAWGRACEQVTAAVETLLASARPLGTAGTMHVSATPLFFAFAGNELAPSGGPDGERASVGPQVS